MSPKGHNRTLAAVIGVTVLEDDVAHIHMMRTSVRRSSFLNSATARGVLGVARLLAAPLLLFPIGLN
jgi:hypothetical protein